MYKVFFSPTKGRDRIIGKAKLYQDAETVILDFLKEKNYKAPYWRMWKTTYHNKPATKYDVGSHTEFFYIIIS